MSSVSAPCPSAGPLAPTDSCPQTRVLTFIQKVFSGTIMSRYPSLPLWRVGSLEPTSLSVRSFRRISSTVTRLRTFYSVRSFVLRLLLQCPLFPPSDESLTRPTSNPTLSLLLGRTTGPFLSGGCRWRWGTQRSSFGNGERPGPKIVFGKVETPTLRDPESNLTTPVSLPSAP